jgi:hypothetical protein
MWCALSLGRLDCLTFEDGSIGCTETSLTNCRSTLREVPRECRFSFPPLRKSQIATFFVTALETVGQCCVESVSCVNSQRWLGVLVFWCAVTFLFIPKLWPISRWIYAVLMNEVTAQFSDKSNLKHSFWFLSRVRSFCFILPFSQALIFASYAMGRYEKPDGIFPI